jgi:collagenase-like PrtC family protease
VLSFYDDMSREAAIDTVYLGEAVCSRRREMRLADWLDVAQVLREAGKKVVFTTQALLESESDLKELRRIAGEAGNLGCALEANDLGAAALAVEHGLPFVCGTHLNIYNAATLGWFAERGAIGWVPPLESTHDMIAPLHAARPEGFFTEIFAFGKLPLALSARCFTARHYRLNKDDCQFKCGAHADGMLVKTREGQPFLTINGIETMSAQTCNLLPYVGQMQAMGIEAVRVSPQSAGTSEVLAAFAAALAGQEKAVPQPPEGFCDGYWTGKPGIALTAHPRQ